METQQTEKAPTPPADLPIKLRIVAWCFIAPSSIALVYGLVINAWSLWHTGRGIAVGVNAASIFLGLALLRRNAQARFWALVSLFLSFFLVPIMALVAVFHLAPMTINLLGFNLDYSESPALTLLACALTLVIAFFLYRTLKDPVVAACFPHLDHGLHWYLGNKAADKSAVTPSQS